jgi:hypothetical protein
MRFLIALFLPALAAAAVWPETIGAWKRASTGPAALSDRALWDEYGFKEGETARYESAGKAFTASAWRLQDSTGAVGAFNWQSGAAKNTLLQLEGNWVLSFSGYRPTAEELKAVIDALPRMARTPPPTLPDYLPSKDLAPDSQRYILGPEALARFAPSIPPSVAAFHLGSEGALAQYRAPKVNLSLAIFNYPTPQIAMQQVEGFQKLPGAVAKRAGPMVAVVLPPADPDAAERLLALVKYEASITMSEYVPTQRDNIGDLILNIFVLTGLLVAFAAVSGVAVGGLRTFLRRGFSREEPESMITLHLEDRR